MAQQKKSKKEFLKLPTYPGGKKAFNQFIKENLKYPKEAIENKIEGDVLLSYEVNDNGQVLNPIVVHGIGSGCDEEALRVISLLKFPKVSNRGVRVKSRFNTRIPFRLPKRNKAMQINYSIATKEEPKPATTTRQNSQKTSYNWQLQIKPKN